MLNTLILQRKHLVPMRILHTKYIYTTLEIINVIEILDIAEISEGKKNIGPFKITIYIAS